ncbi:UPF0161 protein At3g09310 [Selaginella moellendorffii]|uniref:UPF0161 protein At3g09310 n=1 Tax=Selaginella moellendorffii TaxID=88036 RepID=UPI000D1C3CD4|nr:UPF0161 protein At3g09310 [Selaginella moellendorffii]|eukprot:XP_002984616.2 UPF0161 protein At3g09310 [Selaginella moellendorffii]
MGPNYMDAMQVLFAMEVHFALPPTINKKFLPVRDTVLSRQRCRCGMRGRFDKQEPDGQKYSPGVDMAVSFLKFYKREISPLLPGSCRFVPTCSDYSIQAYQKYGVVKGTILTGSRLLRCNPLGPSGFDPPRWFDEEINEK